MESPQVSVVIPTYNRARLVARAIRSALAQTFDDFEVIVVDDGSTDDTERVVAGFDDPRVRYVPHSANGGEAAARNTGVAAARGIYIAFLDSDDEWFPDKLHEQMRAFPAGSDRIRASCTGYELKHIDTGEVETVITRKPASWLEQLLGHGSNIGMGSTLLVERKVFDEIGPFDLNLPRLTDGDWLIRYVKCYDMDVFEKPLARVYYDARNASAGPMTQSVTHFLAKNRENYLTLSSAVRSRALARMWFNLSAAHHRVNNRLPALWYFVKGLALAPVQRPGVYVLLLDRMLGTSLAAHGVHLKRRWLDQR